MTNSLHYFPQGQITPPLSVTTPPQTEFEKFQLQFLDVMAPGAKNHDLDSAGMLSYLKVAPKEEIIYSVLKAVFDPRNLDDQDFATLFKIEQEFSIHFRSQFERMDFYNQLMNLYCDYYPRLYFSELNNVWMNLNQPSGRLFSFYSNFRRDEEEACMCGYCLSPEEQDALSKRVLESGICHGLSISYLSNQPEKALFRKGRFFQAAATVEFEKRNGRSDFKVPPKILEKIGLEPSRNPVLPRKNMADRLMNAAIISTEADRFVLCLMTHPTRSNHDIAVSFDTLSFYDQNSLDKSTLQPIVHQYSTKEELITALLFHMAGHYPDYRQFRLDKYTLPPEKMDFDAEIQRFHEMPKSATTTEQIAQFLKKSDPKVIQANQDSIIRLLKTFAAQQLVTHFDSFGIQDQKARIDLAKYCARQNPAMLCVYYPKFQITDPEATVEIARDCLEKDFDRVLPFFFYFGLSDYDHPLVEFVDWAQASGISEMLHSMDEEFSVWAAWDLWKCFRDKSLRDSFDSTPPLKVEAHHPWGRCLRLQLVKLKAAHQIEDVELMAWTQMPAKMDYEEFKAVCMRMSKAAQ